MTTELATTEQWTPEQTNLIRSMFGKDLSNDELSLFLYTAKRCGLDPLARQIYAVKRGGRMTIQTAIDGYRLIADRTGKLAGISDYIYDSEDKVTPGKATVTVNKMVEGVSVPFTASARWSEYCAGGPMWQKMPYLMLGKCYSGDTEVLTVKGFQRFDAVTATIMQATDDLGVWPTDAKVFSQKYDGPMIEYTKDMLAFCVTPNHDMVTTLGKVEARAVYETATTRPVWFVPMAAEAVNPDDDRYTDAALRLAGYIIADGTHNGHRRFNVAVSKPYKVEALSKLNPTDVGIRHSRGDISTGVRAVKTNFDKTIFSFDMGMVEGLVDEYKLIPQTALYSMSPRQCRILIDAWQEFDGHTNKKTGVRRIYTSRESHVGLIEFLACKAGYSVSSPKPRESDLSDKTNWCLTISSPKPQPILRGGLAVSPNESGQVWCVTVPSGKIIVRRNGFSFVCGNCAEALALRKAFPADLSGVYTAEEMAQADGEPQRQAVEAEVQRQKEAYLPAGHTPLAEDVTFKRVVERTDYVPPELDWMYQKTSGVLICRVVDVQKKTKKAPAKGEFIAVKLNQQIDGKDLAFYFHESHADELLAAKGQVCKFIVGMSADGKFLNVDQVMEINGQPVAKESEGDPEVKARLLASTLDFSEEALTTLLKECYGDWAGVLLELKRFQAEKEGVLA